MPSLRLDAGLPIGDEFRENVELDDGVAVVDANNDAPVKVLKHKLKEEALSMSHFISHRFKNPYRLACIKS